MMTETEQNHVFIYVFVVVTSNRQAAWWNLTEGPAKDDVRQLSSIT